MSTDIGCGSVVECLTPDRGIAGSILTGGTALCPWARHSIPCLVLTCPDITEKLLTAKKKSKQTVFKVTLAAMSETDNFHLTFS